MTPTDSLRTKRDAGDGSSPSDVSRKVLFLAQLPPPLHGASVVSQRVHDMLVSHSGVELTHIWLGGAAGVADVGRRSLAKLLAFARFLSILAWHFVTGRRYDLAYLTLAPFSHAAIRDGLLIGMSRLLARRTLVHLHAGGLDNVMTGPTLPKRLLRWLIADVELIAITEKVARSSEASGLFRAVHLLPNCSDDPGEPEFTTAPELRCGFLANLDRRKGVVRFLDCIVAFQRAGLPVSGRIAGPPTAEFSMAELEGEIASRGLQGDILVLGPLYGVQKLAFYADLDLFLYLSLHDYFPLVLIEAMSSGAVPIVFDNSGEGDLVGPEFAGNVVSPRLPTERMTQVVCEIARIYHERPDKLHEDRRAARARFAVCFNEDLFRERLAAILDHR